MLHIRYTLYIRTIRLHVWYFTEMQLVTPNGLCRYVFRKVLPVIINTARINPFKLTYGGWRASRRGLWVSHFEIQRSLNGVFWTCLNTQWIILDSWAAHRRDISTRNRYCLRHRNLSATSDIVQHLKKREREHSDDQQTEASEVSRHIYITTDMQSIWTIH